jgi:Heterokaryon incompatibility protein (HET)
MAMENRLKYGRYVRLPAQNSFRLLKITNRGPPIQFSLWTFDIGSHPAYTALLYTCGDLVNEDALETENRWIYHPFLKQKANGKLTVTSNLYDALLQLQYSGLTGYLWVDAIYIAQSNPEERSHQVNMMCKIYKNASCVLVWLGKEDESAPVIVSLVHQLASCVQNASPYFVDQVAYAFSLGLLPSLAVIERLGIPQFTNKENLIMSIFLNQQWFQRNWIIQEVALVAQAEML